MLCISFLHPLSGLFLILGGSQVCSSLSVTSGQNLTVAVIGETACLSCLFSPSPLDSAAYELIWTRRIPLPEYNVFQLRGGRWLSETQDSRYRGRAVVDQSGLREGEASLQLYNTSVWDEGQYECFLFQDPDYQKVHLQLLLAAPYSRPAVSCEPQPGNASRCAAAVLLRCRVEGGYPEGEMRWLLKNGSFLHSPVVHSRDSRGLYSLQSSTVWPAGEPSEPVSCTVHNPRLNQTVSSTATCSSPTCSGDEQEEEQEQHPRGRLLVVTTAVLCVVFGLIGAWKLRRLLCVHGDMYG